MKKYILFDLDGTLTEPKEGITKSVQYALDSIGIHEPDLNNLIKFIGPPLEVSFKEYYGLNDADTKEAVKRYRERYKDVGIFENSIYDGVTDMLDALKKQGAGLALATSKPDIFAERIVDEYGMRPYLDAVAGGKINGSCVKADVIREAFEKLGIGEDDKKNVIMVGDREHDIIGANECGIESVGVYFGYAAPGELEAAGATYIVSSMGELKQLLLELSSEAQEEEGQR